MSTPNMAHLRELAARIAASKSAQAPAPAPAAREEGPEATRAVGHNVQHAPTPGVPVVPAVQPAPAPAPSAMPNAMAAIMAAARAKREALAAGNPAQQALAALAAPASVQPAGIQWNAEQAEAIALAAQDASFCLVGAAGTGKTTTVQRIVEDMLERYEHSDQLPVALVAFTNRAVKNLRRACQRIANPKLREKALARCMTIHKLLKFQPVYYDVTLDDGTVKRTMRFEPLFRTGNTLDLELVVVDEASMVRLDLYKQLLEGVTHGARFLYIGDLNQLKPVGMPSILGYKLDEVPVVELTTVYRQALESPIVRFQHEYTLRGKPCSDTDLKRITETSEGKLQFRPLTQHREASEQAYVLANAMRKAYKAGEYSPAQDIILLPNNIGFGTEAVNRWIAQWAGDERRALVHEVLARDKKHYLAEGDFVVYNKEEYFIASITRNRHYAGAEPKDPAIDLTRTGVYRSAGHACTGDLEDAGALFAAQLAAGREDVKLACSHRILLTPAGGQPSLELAAAATDGTGNLELDTCGEVNELEFGYACTIYKSQGSEWSRVFLCFTDHHTPGLRDREALYTAMTRAKEQLIVYYSPQGAPGAKDSSVCRAIMRPSIPGTGWRQKLEKFRGRWDEYVAFMAVETDYSVPNGTLAEL